MWSTGGAAPELGDHILLHAPNPPDVVERLARRLGYPPDSRLEVNTAGPEVCALPSTVFPVLATISGREFFVGILSTISSVVVIPLKRIDSHYFQKGFYVPSALCRVQFWVVEVILPPPPFHRARVLIGSSLGS